MFRLTAAVFIIASFFMSSYAMAEQCNNSGHRLFIEYRQQGFGNVTQVREWCNGFMNQFSISQDRFDEHCGWTRTGSYGRYSYDGNFIYANDYAGQPQFYFQPYCND